MIKEFFTLLPAVVLIDYVWLGFIAQKFYLSELGSLARKVNGEVSFHLPTAFLTYILIALGITIFVVEKSNSYMLALGYGALFGLVVYGVYDFSNYAVLQSWPWKIVIADIVWGMFLCAVLAVIGYWVSNK